MQTAEPSTVSDQQRVRLVRGHLEELRAAAQAAADALGPALAGGPRPALDAIDELLADWEELRVGLLALRAEIRAQLDE